ncbi:MAG: hypothetical protein ACKODS_05535, partial [Methylophilaceae bacterium]
MNTKVAMLLLLPILCSFDVSAQSLRITLHNKTGFDLDSVLFEKHFIGYIRKDSTAILTSLRS